MGFGPAVPPPRTAFFPPPNGSSSSPCRLITARGEVRPGIEPCACCPIQCPSCALPAIRSSEHRRLRLTCLVGQLAMGARERPARFALVVRRLFKGAWRFCFCLFLRLRRISSCTRRISQALGVYPTARHCLLSQSLSLDPSAGAGLDTARGARGQCPRARSGAPSEELRNQEY
jgi:hypothetical protein